MVYDEIIHGRDIYLRALTVADCGGAYLRWLNDPQVNSYLESRHTVQTLEDTQRYVLDIRQSAHSYLFAIVQSGTDAHVGNVKVGPVHPHYSHAFLGYLIGEQSCWGRGYATQAVYLATRFCFDTLGLNKAAAGVIAPNVGSVRVLERVGYTREGCLRQDVLVDGAYRDTYRYGILREEFVINPEYEPNQTV